MIQDESRITSPGQKEIQTGIKQLKFSCSNLNNFVKKELETELSYCYGGQKHIPEIDLEIVLDKINSIFTKIDVCSFYQDNRDGLVFHGCLQNTISNLSKEFGLSGYKEIYVYDRGDNSPGRLDVVWFWLNIPIVAIEIDHRFRRKSLKKLSNYNCQYKIWLYYGDPKARQFEDNYYADIELIQRRRGDRVH